MALFSYHIYSPVSAQLYKSNTNPDYSLYLKKAVIVASLFSR
nr:MAG TPA: hypothetical protein [Caudoviricetes sp.]